MEKELIVAIFLGVGLSASCGFRVFVPMLLASIAARFGYLPVNESFEWLASGSAIICFSAATVVELLAYYIPFVDNLLDALAMPLAIGAGTLLTASVLPVEENMLKWVLALIVGGSTASVFQGATSVSRLSSSQFTAGFGNPLIATGENAVALGLPLLVIAFPLVLGSVILLVMIWLLRKLFIKKKKY
ncbi:DUF4126 domain-containing protein [uncultured Draconibacterium sp.]|uniref:DUF4126 domain-containing protein n=1 Tax=uncultured Draconibacterium sp. TaxID=1573823 RepID=UPI0032615F11